MITIIREGKIKKPSKCVWQFTCPDCGCVFNCECEDFEEIEKCPGGDRVISCPTCGHKLHTKSNFYTINIDGKITPFNVDKLTKEGNL